MLRTWIIPLLLSLGCARAPSALAPDQGATPPVATVAPPASAAPVSLVPAVQHFEAQLMGTPWRITVAGAAQPQAQAAASAAFAEVARIEAAMSEWQPGSELSRINAAAGQPQPVQISPETFALIERAVALGAQTDGAFDVTWAALRGLWRFSGPPKLPKKTDLDARLRLVGYQRVALDAAQHTVRLPEAGMALGLGGIAKGYGIDRVVAVLRSHGLSRFIVDGGGDLYLAGEKAPGVPWTVGVKHPRAERLVATLSARDAAVVSSGDYERFFELGGRRYHHIIDLKTGLPAARSVAVTVRAAEATLADALATAIFVLGPQAGIALAAELPGVEAAVLAPDGSIAATPGLQSIFKRKRWED